MFLFQSYYCLQTDQSITKTGKSGTTINKHSLFQLNQCFRKSTICNCETKGADQRLCIRHTDSTISLLLKSEFQASSMLLCLYRLVCVRPGRQPKKMLVFSRTGSITSEFNIQHLLCHKKDQMNRDVRKTIFRISDQVLHKPTCTFSEKNARSKIESIMSRDARKPVFGNSDQVRYSPAYTVTEKTWKLEILDITRGEIVVSEQRKQRR